MVAVLWLFGTPVVAAEIYRWTDEAGHVHFGDRAPATGAERLQVMPPPAATELAAERAGRTQRLLDTFAQERAERREERAAAAAAAAERAHQCAAARENRRRFEHAGRIVQQDDAGNRVVLDGEAYETVGRELQEAVDRLCKPS